MKTFRMSVVNIFILLLITSSLKAYDGSMSITSEGKSRSFIFHSPGVSVSPNLPVLFVFHGDNGSGEGIKNYTGFNSVSDANNFIVVYPNADNTGGGWHRAIDQPKDVQFTSDMIDYFCSVYQIDASRVYATGHSAGGFMTYNLAVNLPGKIAAFAPVAANMYANNGNYNYFSSPAFKPVAICHIHGDADQTVSYPDPNNSPTPWSEWPLTQFSYYSCSKNTYSQVVPISAKVSKLVFCAPNPGTTKEISMIRVADKGHEWPTEATFNPAQAIWDFVKDYSITGAQSCAVAPSFAEGTIHTNGKDILTPCNEVFVPRGVNYSLADDWEFPENMNGGVNGYNAELSTEIIKSKSNTVRIQWYANRASGWKPYSVANLDQVVTRFRNAGIVSIIELHDVTCSDSYATFNAVILPWWKQQAVLNMLSKHKGWVIANLANEFGTVKWATNPSAAFTAWVNHYKNAITEIRNAGVQVALMIDAPDCGQSLDIALQSGESLRIHDPLKNVVISAHAYWYLDDAATMESKVQSIAAATFPVVLGEIANVQDATGQCSNGIPAYKNLLQSCQNHNVGWLAWTWTDDWCNGRRISLAGDAGTLTDYGNTIVNDPNFGLKLHAIPINNACAQVPLPVTLTYLNAVWTGEDQVMLEWSASRQERFKAFLIERSEDGRQFQEIGSVEGKNSDQLNNYFFQDNRLKSNHFYYRLKMVDLDGSIALSRIVSVTSKNANTIVVYPSPTHQELTIGAPEHFFPAGIILTDLAGRKVLTKNVKSVADKIDVSFLADGLYIVTIDNRVIGKVFVKKN